MRDLRIPAIGRSTMLSALAAVTMAAHPLVSGHSIADDSQGVGSITVVYNHEAGGGETDLEMQGGFAAVIRLGGRTIIFDAGSEASVIQNNLEKLGLVETEVEALFISHNHWDHVYGLPGVMRWSSNSPSVYAAASAADGIKQQFPRATVIGVSEPTEIHPGVWSTGPIEVAFMGAPLSEQAVVLDRPDGLYVIAGCSHPGIVALVKRAREMFPTRQIQLVAGGFHLRSTDAAEIRGIASELKGLGVRRIGPSHCTGHLAEQIFSEIWGAEVSAFKLGDTIRF